MGRSQTTARVVDGILMAALSAGTIATALALPGSALALAPLMSKYAKGYTKRQKEREYRRLVMYMQRQDLLALHPRDGNGLVLTKKGRKRALQAQISTLTITPVKPWDHTWRIVLFDIPETRKSRRDSFTEVIRRLGMYQLQKSTWVHPFPCQDVINTLAVHLEIDQYITFIEAHHIDHEAQLITKFPDLSP